MNKMIFLLKIIDSSFPKKFEKKKKSIQEKINGHPSNIIEKEIGKHVIEFKIEDISTFRNESNKTIVFSIPYHGYIKNIERSRWLWLANNKSYFQRRLGNNK